MATLLFKTLKIWTILLPLLCLNLLKGTPLNGAKKPKYSREISNSSIKEANKPEHDNNCLLPLTSECEERQSYLVTDIDNIEISSKSCEEGSHHKEEGSVKIFILSKTYDWKFAASGGTIFLLSYIFYRFIMVKTFLAKKEKKSLQYQSVFGVYVKNGKSDLANIDPTRLKTVNRAKKIDIENFNKESILLEISTGYGTVYVGEDIAESELFKGLKNPELQKISTNSLTASGIESDHHLVIFHSQFECESKYTREHFTSVVTDTHFTNKRVEKEDLIEPDQCTDQLWSHSFLKKEALGPQRVLNTPIKTELLEPLLTKFQLDISVGISNREVLHQLLVESLKILVVQSSFFKPHPKVLLPSSQSFDLHKLHSHLTDMDGACFNTIMSNHFERMASFSNWPISAPMSALRMVDAGFFINMQTAKVNCFSCGFEINSMNELEDLVERERKRNDNPAGLLLRMHNRERPDCIFTKEELRKLGQDVVDFTAPRENKQPENLENAFQNLDLSEVVQKGEPRLINGLNLLLGKPEQRNAASYSTMDSRGMLNGPISGATWNGGGHEVAAHGASNSIYQNDTAPHNYNSSSFLSSMSLLSRPGDSLIPNNLPQPLINRDISSGLLPTIQTEQGPVGAFISAGYEEKYNYSLKHPQYDNVPARLESFKNWMHNEKQNYRNLIPAGFFYTGTSDIVRCFCCDIGLAEWDPEDDPWEEHARHSPNCKFLKEKKGEMFINQIQAEWRKIYNPKHAAYNELQTRIDSFQGWSDELTQRPRELAIAGFFYSGEGDVVRCHYCDGGLREWEPADDPWTEHAKWFPFCKYVMKVKGIGYIEEVARQHEAESLAEEAAASHDDVPRDLPLTSEAQPLLTMGYTEHAVRYIVNKFVDKFRHSDYSAQELMQIVIELEDSGVRIPTQPPASSSRQPRSIDNAPSSATASIMNSQHEEEKNLDPSQIAKENEKLKNQLICIKCNAKDRNMVFIPCGHRLMCEGCAVKEKKCSKCNKVIKKKVKTFLV